MSAGKELWKALYNAMLANAQLVALVDGIYDKAPSSPWGGNQAYISRGPFVGTSDDSDCIIGQEFTVQIDIWSRNPNRWSVDDIISEVRAALHEQELTLESCALASLSVRLSRVIDDPDPSQQHGVIQVLAFVEEAD
ncbi:DUF3168 domain-containing protein [Rhizobium sp. SGZ-381]|uniref:DUF3168 domain-containing protein n=1 Tax=Rhizobium sp. SGZ-381 TaxID=3342800 RepID=UPI00366CCBAB